MGLTEKDREELIKYKDPFEGIGKKKLEECEKCGYKWEKTGVIDVDIDSEEETLTKQVTIDISSCPKCVNEEWEDEEKAYLAELEKLVEKDDYQIQRQ